MTPGLLPADVYVDADIRVAESLPARAFIDPDFLELETQTIFSRHWLFAPQRGAAELRADSRSLTDLVRLRGSQVPLTIQERPLFLQRDWRGRLHCLPNVCTHAWYPLVHGPGRERTIVCRQHGRRFDTMGKFVSQPGFDSVNGFSREADDLPDYPAEEWGQFIFVALGQPAVPFKQALGKVWASVTGLPLQDFHRCPQSGEEREVEGNWKQHAWNYMDKFHLEYIHRAPNGLADSIEMDSYRTELYPYTSLQWAYARSPEHGFDPELLPRRFAHQGKRVFALWWFVFPNLTLNFYPWGLSINVYMPIPDRPERTLFLWYHYVFDEQKYQRHDEIWLNQQVDAEDVDAMRQVRRGARSGFAPRGRFAVHEEAGPHWFHRLVYQEVFE